MEKSFNKLPKHLFVYIKYQNISRKKIVISKCNFKILFYIFIEVEQSIVEKKHRPVYNWGLKLSINR